MANLIRGIRRMGRMAKIALALVVILGLYTLVGFLVLPSIVKTSVEKRWTRLLHRQTHIAAVDINPYALTITVHDLHVRDRGGAHDLFSFERLFLNFDGTSIFKMAPMASTFRLEKPIFRIVRLGPGQYNFSDLISSSAPAPTGKGGERGKSRLFRFSLAQIEVVDGKGDVVDRLRNKRHKIRALNFSLPLLSDIGEDIDKFSEPRLSALINGTPFVLSGKSKPFADSLETDFKLSLKAIDLTRYMAYLPLERNFKVVRGMMDIDAGLAFVQSAARKAHLTVQGRLVCRDLKIVDHRERPLLDVAQIAVQVAPSRLLGADVHVAQISLQAPEVHLTRDRAGTLNMATLVPVEVPAAPALESGAGYPLVLRIDALHIENGGLDFTDFYQTPGGGDPLKSKFLQLSGLTLSGIALDTAGKKIEVESVAGEKGVIKVERLPDGELSTTLLRASGKSSAPEDRPTGTSPAWQVTVGQVRLDDFRVRAEQLASAGGGNFTLDGVVLTSGRISTRPDVRSKMMFTAALNKSGHVQFQGQAGLNPASAALDTTLTGINLWWFQPFIDGQVGLAVTGGELSATGKLALSSKGITFRGRSSITDFASIDKAHGEDLVKWHRLTVDGIDVGNAPAHVRIAQVGVEKLHGRVIVSPQGMLNLKQVLKSPASGQSAPAEKHSQPSSLAASAEDRQQADQALSFVIDKVVFSGSRIDFTDRSISPRYRANLKAINGQIDGLSFEKGKRAKVMLKARLNSYAPLEIKGRIYPFAKARFMDMRVRLDNVDVNPLTPYGGRYLGYKIRSGKLSLDLNYLIDRQKLTARNDVAIDRLEFGQAVNSPDALHVPLKLAVALLKDRQGKISLHVPVSGRLDDPDFSLGGTIVQIIVNLFVKAATSPFSLVSAVFGGGQDLRFVEFAPGSAELSAAAQGKLDKLETALYERPGLKLDISGFSDAQKDAQALAAQQFDRLLKVQKLKQMMKKSTGQLSLAAVHIDAKEYERYLKKAYHAAKFKKPRNFLGIEKDVPVSQMEALIRKNIHISPDDLRTLADQRTQAVKVYLLGRGRIDPARIFVAGAAGSAAEQPDGVAKSRVQLSLK